MNSHHSPEPSDDHPSPHVRSAGDERCCPPTIRRRGCVGHRATTFRAPLARAAHACMLIVVRRSRCVDRVRVDLSITAAGAAHSVCVWQPDLCILAPRGAGSSGRLLEGCHGRLLNGSEGAQPALEPIPSPSSHLTLVPGLTLRPPRPLTAHWRGHRSPKGARQPPPTARPVAPTLGTCDARIRRWRRGLGRIFSAVLHTRPMRDMCVLRAGFGTVF